MKFLVTRSARTEHSLRFFRSCRVWRDDRTGETMVLWRPARFLSLVFLLVVVAPLMAVVAAKWWLDVRAPGVPIGYLDVGLPWRWPGLPKIWRDYQIALAPPDALRQPGSGLPGTPAQPGETPEETLGPRPTLSPALAQLFLRNGTLAKLQGIKSVKAHGTVTLPNGQQLDFTMVKKFPAQMRLNILDRNSNVQLTKLSRRGEGWQWVGNPDTNGVQKLSADGAAALAREVWYCSATLEILYQMEQVRELDPAPPAAAGRAVLALPLPPDMQVEIYLEAKTSRPEQIRFQGLLGGVPGNYDILVPEWKVRDGVPEPAALEVLVNGEKLLTCRFSEISYNIGAYDVMFEPPAGAVITDSAPDPGGAGAVRPGLAQPSQIVPDPVRASPASPGAASSVNPGALTP